MQANKIRDVEKVPKPYNSYTFFPRMKPYLSPEQEAELERKEEELRRIADLARMTHNEIFHTERQKLLVKQTNPI